METDILKKQHKLESYLLENPTSPLFAWYARQNMEIGKLDRAKKICLLGIKGGAHPPIFYKLLGDISLTQGETVEARGYYEECLKYNEPYKGVMELYLKLWHQDISKEQAENIFDKLNILSPLSANNLREKLDFSTKTRVTETMAVALDLSEESASEAPPIETDSTMDAPIGEIAPESIPEAVIETVDETDDLQNKPVDETIFNLEEERDSSKIAPTDEFIIDPLGATTPPDPAHVLDAIIDEQKENLKAEAEKNRDDLDETPPDFKVHFNGNYEPSAGDEESSSAGPNTSSQITESMATFTLMQIFKDQGLYDQALRVLDLLRSSSPNIERIEKEAAEIKQLLIDKQALENK